MQAMQVISMACIVSNKLRWGSLWLVWNSNLKGECPTNNSVRKRLSSDQSEHTLGKLGKLNKDCSWSL